MTLAPGAIPLRIQRLIVALSIVLFLAKMVAYYLTHSVAIFTDALESTVNVITGFIGLFSMAVAAKPRDLNHPYGHGKAEFVSAAIEGTLIFIAGLLIIYESVDQLIEPRPLHDLNWGLAITAGTGVLNAVVGLYAARRGKQAKSATLAAAGKHLVVDAYSSFAILLGLALMMLTGWAWLDSVVALLFAGIILATGYRVVRSSLGVIMDESDETILIDVIDFLQGHRRPSWIDIHNVRVIRYGDLIHLDAHMTLPWYWRVADGEREIHEVEGLIQERFGGTLEVFIHIDPCAPFSCKLCALDECPVRQERFESQLVWDSHNVWHDRKHGYEVGDLEPGVNRSRQSKEAAMG